MSTEQIYVALLDEGVDVWRPVEAVRVAEHVYKIAEQPYDAAVETWEFKPGEVVECEFVKTAEGTILAAKRKR